MTTRLESERLEQAAAWRLRLTESPEQHRGEFSSWLASDYRNREAWRFVQIPWQFLGEQSTAPEVIRLRRAALVHAHDTVTRNQVVPEAPRRTGWFAAATVLVLAVGFVLAWQQFRSDDYRTTTGERRIIMLADGSQITLDSRSEVIVRYTADARALTLLRGQARFDVAHDTARPFTVTADGHTVVATGTAFDVDFLGPNLLVTLIKGHVVILPRKVSAPTPLEGTRIELSPGDQAVMSSGDVAPRVSRADLERVTAWEKGEIVFDNEPLASVIQRMNRYGPRQILVADQRAADLRISGAFHAGDVDGFVSTLASYLPLRARERLDGKVVLSYHTETTRD